MQISINNVEKSFDDVTALDGVSLEIPSGSTFGVLGTNGAGKTTLFKLITGLDTIDGGQILVGSRDVQSAGLRIRDQIGYLPEHVGFPAGLTGQEVIEFHAKIRGIPCDERTQNTLGKVGLSDEAIDRAVSGYSNGMRRRLGLACALLSSPEILLLDEPTAGLDPRGVTELHQIIQSIRAESEVTVVLSSHVLSEVQQLCDHIAILHDGALLTTGQIGDLVATSEMTVHLRPEHAESITTLHNLVSEFGVADSTAVGVTVTCAPEKIPSLFARLDDHVNLEGVRIDRDGLESVFHTAIAEKEETA